VRAVLRGAGTAVHKNRPTTARSAEFIFRFNRRQSSARGLLFYGLMQNAVIVKKLDYETIVWSRRGQAGKLRGPRRKPVAKSKTP
jgi:hypothetical protein